MQPAQPYELSADVLAELLGGDPGAAPTPGETPEYAPPRGQ